jgi:glycosyltransferase involved in cell wall biosynthesis
MHVTVAICTWNRAEQLDGTLTSLAGVTIPAGVTWDVIVANNNSTDPTEEVLDAHAARLPLTRLFVPRQGKSYALNEIVDRLQGDLVLWTDDDVVFAEDWIASYIDAARRWPEAAFFGGRIIPRFLSAEPDWLRPAWQILAGVYAERELGDEPIPFSSSKLPYGANMAVRVGVQKQYRYNSELGRRGNLLLSCEETELAKQWLIDGHVGMWVPQSRVEHMIPPERLELDYIRRFFFDLARSAHLRRKTSEPLTRFFRGTWYACRAIGYRVVRASHSQTTETRRWMKYLVRNSYCWGRVRAEWGGLPRWLEPPPTKRPDQAKPASATRPESCTPPAATADIRPFVAASSQPARRIFRAA